IPIDLQTSKENALYCLNFFSLFLYSTVQQVKAVAEELGIGFLGIGFQPKWGLKDIPIMPKGRYEIMRKYMPKVGSLGLDMMFRTCTVQVNLDFSSESDMIRK
ncbi:PREDICTED: glutamate--cysteine ligase, chloroplastic-like, partial [Nelumbo nucifera]|uniref:glutamate--cysteine ligase n=1 Tax=Nelumbo nucifera TaxID=4432 RepID=A0A1U7YSD9_NELNU